MNNKGILAALALLAGCGAVAAFATIAPQSESAQIPQATPLIEALAIHPGDAVLAGPASYIREEQFQRGDTLASFLGRLGIDEVQVLGGRPVRAGRLLAAEFVNHGKMLRAVNFQSSYYTPDGKNLRKAFLRSPLEFPRVSSGFGIRTHPIHGGWRRHAGIDYAAPTGTRVREVGDGLVEFAARKDGYGNAHTLRHT